MIILIILLILFLGILYYIDNIRNIKNEHFIVNNSVILNVRPPVPLPTEQSLLKEIYCNNESGGTCLNVMDIRHVPQIIT